MQKPEQVQNQRDEQDCPDYSQATAAPPSGLPLITPASAGMIDRPPTSCGQTYPAGPQLFLHGAYLSDLFLGAFLLSVETSNFAEVGAWIELLITISFALTPFP
jgi:hypothetical protein